MAITVPKPRQFDNQSCCLLMRHGQCTRKTMLDNMLISLQFRKKTLYRVQCEYSQGYRKSVKC